MIKHQISLTEAIDLTRRFREKPAADVPYSETFDAASVRLLLALPGCASLRLYLGRKLDNRICTVLVAVDVNGHDILPLIQPGQSTAAGDGIILEDALQCPPVCPPPSPLNG